MLLPACTASRGISTISILRFRDRFSGVSLGYRPVLRKALRAQQRGIDSAVLQIPSIMLWTVASGPARMNFLRSKASRILHEASVT